VIGGVTYHLVAHTLSIQFKDILVEHFSPHWFGVRTCGECEIVVHGTQMMLDLHLDWLLLYGKEHENEPNQRMLLPMGSLVVYLTLMK